MELSHIWFPVSTVEEISVRGKKSVGKKEVFVSAPSSPAESSLWGEEHVRKVKF